MAEKWKWASVKRTREAAEELKAKIRAKYPDAQFDFTRAPDDPHLWLLWTFADVDDPEEVSALVVDRAVDMVAEDHIPIQVVSMGRSNQVFGDGSEQERKAGQRRTRATALPTSALR